MAAKQGLTAHISQATDDAKRAMIARAPTSIVAHSWLSNLNTTCTIKSAPPRSPEVMTMLSTKSGWLVKRNEQHVWQRRWCCVVPHTFLYYFEAAPLMDGDDENGGGDEGGDGYHVTPPPPPPPSSSSPPPSPSPSPSPSPGHQYSAGGSGSGCRGETTPAVVENQDLLNAAVRDGLNGDGHRSHSSHHDRKTTPEHAAAAAAALAGHGDVNESLDSIRDADLPNPRGPTATSGSNLQPVGIIDLECYSNVNRTNRSEGVMELTGDPITNPDLRSFYFQAANADDAEEWTKAFLSDRHSSLKDEREALREVCNTFPLQLKDCSDMIDRAEEKASESEKELYRVRSMAEEGRRGSLELVRSILERRCWEVAGDDGADGSAAAPSVQRRLLDGLEAERTACLEKLEDALRCPDAVGTMNGGVLPAMHILTEYVSSVIASYTDLRIELSKAEQHLSQAASIEKASLQDLRAKHEKLELDRLSDLHRYNENISKMEEQTKAALEAQASADNHLQTQQMEFKMYQSQSKAKVGEISKHKKILKKEVIDLRKRIEEVGSERDAAKHEAERVTTALETERQRNVTLERYIERIEKQISVQQNMMEMMSQSGSVRDGSILGKLIGPPARLEDDDRNANAVTASSASAKTGRRNRLPRSYMSTSAQPPLRGAADCSERIELGEDDFAPKNIDVDLTEPAPLPVKAEETELPPSGTVTLQCSGVNSPLSVDGSPRTPTITLEQPADYVNNPEKSSRPKSSVSLSLDRDGRTGAKLLGAADPSAEVDEEQLCNDALAVSRDENSVSSAAQDDQESLHGDEKKESIINSNEVDLKGTERRSSRKDRYQRIVASKIGSSVEKYRTECVAENPNANTMASSRHKKGNIPFTDEDLHRTIQDYEGCGNVVDDAFDDIDDAKSHISELTEDRTYKLPYQEQPVSYKVSRAENGGDPAVVRGTVMPSSGVPTGQGTVSSSERQIHKERYSHYPPRYILGKGENNEEKSFVSSRSRQPEVRPPHANSSSPFSSNRSRKEFARDDDRSTGAYRIGRTERLSVAERARLGAQRSSNSVTVRASPSASPLRQRGHGGEVVPQRDDDDFTEHTRSFSPSGQSRKSFLAKVGQRVVTAIDNSVLGVPNMAGEHDDDNSDKSSESESSDCSARDDEHSRKLKNEVTTPLHIRRQIQREQQLAFLKEQGIIKNESTLRGGAGAVTLNEKKSRGGRTSSTASVSSRRSSSGAADCR